MVARRPALLSALLGLALVGHAGAFHQGVPALHQRHPSLRSHASKSSVSVWGAVSAQRLGLGLGRGGRARLAVTCTAAKEKTDTPAASSQESPVKERYPMDSFVPKGWSRHLHNYKSDPARFFLAAADDATAKGSEDAVLLDFGPLFRPKMVLVHAADDVVHIMSNKKGEFCKSKLRRQTAGMVLGDGLLLSEGEKHLRTRKVMRPSFEGSSLAKFLNVMEDACTRMTETIGAAVDASPNGEAVVDISELIQEATLVMVSKCLFSLSGYGDAKMLKNGISNTFRYTSKLQRTPLRGAVKLAGRLGFSSGYKAFKTALDEMDEYVLKIIADRRAGLSDEKKDRDMLDMFLRTKFDDGCGFTDREIRDELVTMLLAGHDTSALVLMWAFNFLIDRPDLADAIAAESARALGEPTAEGWKKFSVETVQGLGETDRFLKEVMRLRPPVYEFTREVARAHTLPSGLRVKKGQTVIVSAYVQGHKEGFWKAPDSFDPARWAVHDEEGRVTTNKPADGTYIPFGFGARTCIGFRFAEWEMAIMLSHVCRNFLFTSAMDAPPDFSTHVTLNPSSPIKIRVSRR